ncbi:hypothetical protein PsorP6_015898 [Peronosclerospora sorghi]|uniref:Uncharacterized protein n=1 Tax=Peronosclerospora sorghi TaxID=230839 RepID=A0ACC0WM34_9STRA|nr:hypothetical protein PsorP6_015898 [Peronosclerospora sorghi]
MASLASTSTLACTSWAVVIPMLLESLLVGLILWRTLYHVYWRSHPRRIVLHIVRTCHARVLVVGIACLWWSNSLVLICTASVIFQWSSAVTAGRVAAQELQNAKRLTVLHPVVCLHAVHLSGTTVMAIYALGRGFDTLRRTDRLPTDVPSLLYRALNVVTVTFDAVGVCYVAMQLKKRLLTVAMVEDMKKKSTVQMTLLMLLLTASLVLELAMDVATFVFRDKVSSALRFEDVCLVQFVIPGLFLSLAFLYIMRRIEQREPAQLATVVPSRSLVEFVECSSPDCVWCAHHRRYLNQKKWETTLLAFVSPRTVDSSDHSSIHAHLSQGSWSSEGMPRPERHQHVHAFLAPARGLRQVASSTHGGYELVPESAGVDPPRPYFASESV